MLTGSDDLMNRFVDRRPPSQIATWLIEKFSGISPGLPNPLPQFVAISLVSPIELEVLREWEWDNGTDGTDANLKFCLVF